MDSVSCSCARSLLQLRNEFNAIWPLRDKASDGCCGDAAHQARKSDHNADASGFAHAFDTDEDLSEGLHTLQWLVRHLLRDSRTKYIIYEGFIYYPDGTVNVYTGANAHKMHLHLSTKAGTHNDVRSWKIAEAATAAGYNPRHLTPIEDLMPFTLLDLVAAAKEGANQALKDLGIGPDTLPALDRQIKMLRVNDNDQNDVLEAVEADVKVVVDAVTDDTKAVEAKPAHIVAVAAAPTKLKK